MNNIVIGCDRVHNHMCAWCFEICSFIYEKYYSKYNVLVQSASAFWWLRKWRLFIYLYVEVEWTTNNFATQYLLGHPSKLGSYICTNWSIWNYCQSRMLPREASKEPQPSFHIWIYLCRHYVVNFLYNAFLFILFIYSHFKWFFVVAHRSVISVISVCSKFQLLFFSK